MSARYLLAIFGPGSDEQALQNRLAILAEERDMRIDQFGSAILLSGRTEPARIGAARALIGCFAELDEPSTDLLLSAPYVRADELPWGDFLHIAFDRAGDWDLCRDPAGGVPAYWHRSGRAVLVSGCARLIGAATGIRPAPNLSALASCLRYPDIRQPATAVAGMHELLPGRRLTVTADLQLRESHYWSPVGAATRMTSSALPADDIAALVAQTAIRAVAPFASQPGPLLLQLSGGADSSLLAAALHRAAIPFSALNVWTPAAEGDERHHAERVASALGIPLAFAQTRAERIDPTRPSACHLPRPTRRLFARDIDQLTQAAAEALRATVILSGGGGDNVFAALAPGLATADAWRGKGIAAAWRTARHEATITRSDIWAIIGEAMRQRGSGPLPDDRFLANVGDIGRPVHPWLADAASLPRGKFAHIEALVVIQNYLDAFDMPAVPTRFPLLCRPMLETCLAIPTWQWVEGGRDRAPARRAFAESLPRSVTTRRGKGGYQLFATDIFERHRPQLRELLMDGFLAGERLLDRSALEAWFAGGDVPTDNRMLSLVAAETWARHWFT